MMETHPAIMANNTPNNNAMPITAKLKFEQQVAITSSNVRMANTPTSSVVILSVFHISFAETLMRQGIILLYKFRPRVDYYTTRQ